MKKTVLTFGLLSGAIIIVYSLGVFLVLGDFSKMSAEDLSKAEMLGYLRYLILGLTVFFAVRHYKKASGNTATFKPLFLAGLYTALVVAALVGLMECAYMLFNPDFMEQYAALSTARMKEAGVSAAELSRHQQQVESMQWMANPAAMGIFYFLETAVIGAVLSLITAALLRRKSSPAPAR